MPVRERVIVDTPAVSVVQPRKDPQAESRHQQRRLARLRQFDDVVDLGDGLPTEHGFRDADSLAAAEVEFRPAGSCSSALSLSGSATHAIERELHEAGRPRAAHRFDLATQARIGHGYARTSARPVQRTRPSGCGSDRACCEFARDQALDSMHRPEATGVTWIPSRAG
jgi:hypothetical protein